MTEEKLTHLLVCLQCRLETIIEQLSTIIKQNEVAVQSIVTIANPPLYVNNEGEITHVLPGNYSY